MLPFWIGSFPPPFERLKRFRSFPITSIQSPAPDSQPLPVDDPIDKNTTPEEIIRRFIHAHHAKSSSRTPASFAADYADRVDFYSHGMVDRDFVREDQQKFYQDFPFVAESVVGEIKVDTSNDRDFDVNYKLDMTLTKHSGERSQKQVQVSMRISLAPGGKPQIFRERGVPIAPPTSAATPAQKNVEDPEETLRTFIKEHFRKASRQDIDGFLSDYSDPVEFYTHGRIKRPEHRQRVDYIRANRSIKEAIKGEINLVRDRSNPRVYTATFQRLVDITTAGGRTLSADSIVAMRIEITPAGPKIFSEVSLKENKGRRQAR